MDLAGDDADGIGRGTALRDLAPGDAELARLVAAGLSDVEIAGRLALCLAEVRAELEALLARMRVRSRTELALLAGGDRPGGAE